MSDKPDMMGMLNHAKDELAKAMNQIDGRDLVLIRVRRDTKEKIERLAGGWEMLFEEAAETIVDDWHNPSVH